MNDETKIREAVQSILEEKEYEIEYLSKGRKEPTKTIVDLDDGDVLIIEG